MNVENLFHDDDAVSPVIGVILMVAITVILAAVIASFVLGLGDTADEAQPNSSFSYDLDNDTPELTITLTDGDTVTAEEIVLRGDAADTPLAGAGAGSNIGDFNGPTISGSDTWDVGQSETIDLDTGTSDTLELRIVWEEVGGDNAATLSAQEFDFDT